MPVASKIFEGYRALGFVSNHVPLAVRYNRKHQENYVVTCVGNSFHTYNCSRLGIVSISDSHPTEIGCLAVNQSLVFTGCGNVVRAFTRGRQMLRTYEGHTKDVHLLLPFGKHLISVDTDSNVIVWDVHEEGIYLELTFNNESFQVTTLMHPSTYLNKIVFGSKQGTLQLWNLKLNKLIYTFKGWGEPVAVVEQAPAVDVVAIGLASGQIILHNLKFDETITKFWQDWGPVTSISFRTDGHPIMATGSTVGHIALWDLEERKLLSQMRDAHSSSVTGMQCLPSEPLMVTSSADNTLKVWIFDMPDGGGRLLRERSGHSAPPNKVRHYGTDGQNILSAGQDSTLRSFSTIHDKHNKSLGRASYFKKKTKKSTLKHDQHKMPCITDFVSESCRQSDWDNILAVHRGLRVVTTWSYDRSTMGQYKLEHQRFSDTLEHKLTVAKAVEISPCGNFGLIGYSSGHVDVYNLQSGIHRGSYGNPKAHADCIQGVVVDSLNQLTTTVARDGEVRFWKFKDKTLLESIRLEKSVSFILLHRESSMLAMAQDDFVISIIDIDTRRVVRKFQGHSSKINDMTFSPDARWLISSSMDCTVRTWDMPTGRLIDCFVVDIAVTSMSMSPTSDFLVTSHIDDIGVYLWSNVTLFSHVPLRPLPADFTPQTVELPSVKPATGDEAEDSTMEVDEYVNSEFQSPEQISDKLVTLALLPNSRWQNLLNLDIIKKRNKPKQPPKVPKSAPFFLPTIAGLEPKFALPDDSQTDNSSDKFLEGSLLPMSTLGKLLQAAADTSDFTKVLEYLMGLGPSGVDMEIRSLAPEGGGSMLVMSHFLKFVKDILQTKTNFEAIQAYLGLFLKLHGNLLSSSEDLTSDLQELSRLHTSTWGGVQDLCNQTLCLVNYLRTATL